MNERFFGLWRIELVLALHVTQARFVISGSSNADGAYATYPNQSLVLAVDGESWTLGFQSWRPASGFGPRSIRRTNSFDRMDGLVAVIEMGGGESGMVYENARLRFYEYVHLRCVSQDPNVNPAPAPNPFDFTLPER